MAKLIYVSNVSLDGYIEDEHGSFDWNRRLSNGVVYLRYRIPLSVHGDEPRRERNARRPSEGDHGGIGT